MAWLGWVYEWSAATTDQKTDHMAVLFYAGIGAVGLAVIEALVARGCKRIIAVDLNDDKEEHARTWGATDFVNPSKIDGATQNHIVDLSNDWGSGSVNHLLVRIPLACIRSRQHLHRQHLSFNRPASTKSSADTSR